MCVCTILENRCTCTCACTCACALVHVEGGEIRRETSRKLPSPPFPRRVGRLVAKDIMNPFRDPSVQHFPQFERAFAASPSIDTLARTQPVEFSLGATGARSPILAGTMSGGSPVFQPSALPHNHRGPTRARSVAKQLDFSLSPHDVHVSRSDAAVAGWCAPTARPRPSGSSAASGARLAARAAATAEGASPLTPSTPDAQATHCLEVAQRHAAVQTDAMNDAEAQTEGRAMSNIAAALPTELSREPPMGHEARSIFADSSGPKSLGHVNLSEQLKPGEAAETAGARPEPARAQPAASLGLPPPRGGSAGMDPIRTAARTNFSPADASGMPAAASAAAPARVSTHAEEERHALRRSLSQPPSYPFTEYLEGLRRRWSDTTHLPFAAPQQTHMPHAHMPQQAHPWRAQSAAHRPPHATYGPSRPMFGGFVGAPPPAPAALPAAHPDEQWRAASHPYAPQPYMLVSPAGPWWPAVACAWGSMPMVAIAMHA